MNNIIRRKETFQTRHFLLRRICYFIVLLIRFFSISKYNRSYKTFFKFQNISGKFEYQLFLKKIALGLLIFGH